MSQKSGESFREALKRDTAFAAIWRRNVEIDLAQRDSIRAFVEEHQNSLVGVFLLSLEEVSMYYSLLEDMMSEASPVFSQHVLVKDKLEKMRQMARRFEAEREKKMTPEEREEQKKRQAMDAKIKIGEHFPNAKVKDNAGEIKQLSDYVGKGKYVLIDFWASWCGPCRNEMPNVKAAYEKYASKGFEVISISIDKKQKPWRTAIEELGMNWTQVLNVDAADVYGIYAIPKTFLVDPEGIVVAKDLRSKKLEKTLFNLLE